MKRFVILICLLLSFAFLCACNKDTNEQESINVWGEEDDAYEVIPLEKKDFAIVYDDKCDMELYGDLGGSFSYPIYILSRTPIDVSTIYADAIGSDGDTFIVEDFHPVMNYEYADGVMNLDYHKHIYQTQKGMDWAEAYRLYRTVQDAKKAMDKDPTDSAAQYDYLEASRAWSKHIRQFEDGYKQEKKEIMDSLSYYVYGVYVRFDPNITKEETVSTIVLNVGNEQYTLSIGRIRLLQSVAIDIGDLSGRTQAALVGSGNSMFLPWTAKGFEFPLSFTAREDLTLEKLEMPTEGCVIGEIHLARTGKSGQTIDMQWDGKSPVYIDEGDEVSIWVTCCDEYNAGKANVRSEICTVLYFSTKTGNLYDASNRSVRTSWSPYELCAVFLDGVDLRNYFIYWEYMLTCDIA